MPLLQDLLHKLEVGGGMRFVRIGLAVLGILLLMLGYNWRAFQNLGSQEAMDTAQLARNLAEGKGYTTLFIRPFSIHLVKKRTVEREGLPPVGTVADLAKLKSPHPDLANPPVYPVVLAGLLKVWSLDYAISTTKPFWSNAGRFWRYKPDFLIGLFNQLLLLAMVAVVYFLARRLFDRGVARLSAGLLLGTELLWRFSVSGLSTMLLMLIFLGLVWCLLLLEDEARAPRRRAYFILVMAGLAGLAVGLGGLTRYAFGWMIIPVLAFLLVFGGYRRFVLAAIALAVFLAVLMPWIVRNYSVSGTPFGTATYSVVETTILHPESRLQRSLEPDLSQFPLGIFWHKLNTNLRQIITTELPKLGGTWITAFFLAGLMIGFRNPAIARLRYFLLASLLVLAVTQALGRTQLSEKSPEINSENLLVLLAPLVLVYGVSLFYVLLEQMRMAFPQLRYIVIGLFSLGACLPMVFVFLPPRSTPVVYPPYHPQVIQQVSGWLKESELAMSDIPWAVAWYGQRQCVWLTQRCMPDPKDTAIHEDFFVINDYQKPVKLLYLTPETMDSRFLSQWIKAGEQSWGSFILQSIMTKRVPPTFPLSASPEGLMPDQLVLMDWERWRKTQ